MNRRGFLSFLASVIAAPVAVARALFSTDEVLYMYPPPAWMRSGRDVVLEDGRTVRYEGPIFRGHPLAFQEDMGGTAGPVWAPSTDKKGRTYWEVVHYGPS